MVRSLIPFTGAEEKKEGNERFKEEGLPGEGGPDHGTRTLARKRFFPALHWSLRQKELEVRDQGKGSSHSWKGHSFPVFDLVDRALGTEHGHGGTKDSNQGNIEIKIAWLLRLEPKNVTLSGLSDGGTFKK